MIPYVALRWPVKKIAACVALLACCLYVGLVVPSVPTTRALLMTGIGLIAIMLDRSPFSLRLVAVSAVAVLVFAPESIWSVSFQMSFAAVTALVAAAEGARSYLTSLYREAGWIKRSVIFIIGTLVTSLIASLATAPYSLFHFQQIATYSVVANAMAVPISGLIIMPMVIASFFLFSSIFTFSFLLFSVFKALVLNSIFSSFFTLVSSSAAGVVSGVVSGITTVDSQW
jgi:competence protein ComEC